MSAVAVSVDQGIDEMCERWARWRRKAERLPTGGFRCTLAGLAAEGATVERGGPQQDESARNLAALRAEYSRRMAALAADLARLMTSPDSDAQRAALSDKLTRLRQLKRQTPTTASGLAWASLIHGHGTRPDPEHPEEEAVEVAVCALPPHMKRVVFEEYLRPGTQEMKAKEIGISRKTFQRYLYAAQREIRRYLQR